MLLPWRAKSWEPSARMKFRLRSRVISMPSASSLAERQGGGTQVAERLVHAGSEQAALEAYGAQRGLLGDGHALEGERFLGIDGPVDGNEAGAEASDFVDLFEADDGELGRAKLCWRAFWEERALPAEPSSRTRRAAALARLTASCFSVPGFFERDSGESDSGMRKSFRLTHSHQPGWSLKIQRRKGLETGRLF
jgi:hypothetical protein